MNEFIIYKAQNLKNGLVYIGATSRCLEERKKDHFQKANKEIGHQFQEAIVTFGEEAFIWDQIDTAESINELATKEKEYILKYNSKEKGYNSDLGGGFKKDVYQYRIDDFTLVGTHDCLDSAANVVNADKKAISKACLNVNNLYNGFYWSYELREPFVPNSDARKKGVIQMDMEGNVIAEFKSVAEASRSTGANKSSIAKCCRKVNKSASGFSWKYNE